MKVHLIKKQTIEDYVAMNASSRISFRNWMLVVKGADWEKPEDILSTFSSADIIGNGSERVVFDIAGNNFRMICQYVFGAKKVHLFICWIGTHAAYTELCKGNRQYKVSAY